MSKKEDNASLDLPFDQSADLPAHVSAKAKYHKLLEKINTALRGILADPDFQDPDIMESLTDDIVDTAQHYHGQFLDNHGLGNIYTAEDEDPDDDFDDGMARPPRTPLSDDLEEDEDDDIDPDNPDADEED